MDKMQKYTVGFYWVMFDKDSGWNISHFHNDMFHGFGVGNTRISGQPHKVSGIKIIPPNETYHLAGHIHEITEIIFDMYKTIDMVSKDFNSDYCLKSIRQRLKLLEKEISLSMKPAPTLSCQECIDIKKAGLVCSKCHIAEDTKCKVFPISKAIE